jgi:hypothetical protein
MTYSINYESNSFTIAKKLEAEFIKKYFKYGISICTIFYKIEKPLPLLQFIGKDLIFLYHDDNMIQKKLNDIFEKYITFTKKSILSCQKKLIENGLIEFAHYDESLLD